MRVGYSSECINPESVSDIELSGYGWYLNRKAHGVCGIFCALAVYNRRR